MANDERALDALNKIQEVLKEVRDLFPTSKASPIAPKRYTNPAHILKRVQGIIYNFNQTNAEQKLENLIKFLAYEHRIRCLKSQAG